MATYVNKLASDKEIIDFLTDYYGVSNNPTSGNSQLIMRDGKFLNNYESQHGDILKTLYMNKLIYPGENSLDYINMVYTNLFEELGLIRCNSNIFHYVYANFPYIRPTEEQFDSFRKWLDKTNIKISGIEINVPNGTNYYNPDVNEEINSDYIINRIKRYYSSGTLYESGYSDYIKQFDYGTEERKYDDDIFDIKKTGFGHWDQFLNKSGLKYMEEEDNKTGSIVLMSPREYIKKCSTDIFHGRVSYSDLLTQRRDYDREKIDWLRELIRKKNKKLCVPFIDYTESGQEGLHRMIAAGEEFGFDHKFPVLVVDWLDKEKHNKDIEDRRIWEIKVKLDKAFSEVAKYHYSDIDEFADELQFQINHAWYVNYNEPDKEFSYKIDGNILTLSADGVSETFDMSDIDIRNEETSNDDPFDDIDISDIDLVM